MLHILVYLWGRGVAAWKREGEDAPRMLHVFVHQQLWVGPVG